MKHTILIENGRWYTYVIEDDNDDIYWSTSYVKLSVLLDSVEDKKMEIFDDIDREYFNKYLRKCKILFEDNKFISNEKLQKEYPELLL